MRLFQNLFSIIAVAGAAATLTPIAASAANYDCGYLQQVKVATVPDVQTTTSKSFVDLSGAQIGINLSFHSCVVIDFSAQVRAAAPNAARIRVTVSGTTTGGFPGSNTFTTEKAFDARAATFLFPNVAAGGHIIRIQFLSVDGSEVQVSKGLMKITYNSGAS